MGNTRLRVHADKIGEDFVAAAKQIEEYTGLVEASCNAAARVQESVDTARSALEQRRQELISAYEQCAHQEDSDAAQEQKQALQRQIQEVEQKLQTVQHLEQELHTVLANLHRQTSRCREGAANGRTLAGKVTVLMAKYAEARDG